MVCKNKIFFVFLLLGIFITSTSFSQDQKANEVLFGAYGKYRTYANIKISFDCTIKNELDQIDKQFKGTGYVKGKKHTTVLKERSTISDGNTTWDYDKSKNMVLIKYYDPKDDEITPFEVFKEDFLTRGLKYKYIGEEGVKDETGAKTMVDVIEFTPKERTRQYYKFRIGIDKSTQLMRSWEVFMKSGGKVYYNMLIKPNVSLPYKIFEFDESKFPNIEVIDKRKK